MNQGTINNHWGNNAHLVGWITSMRIYPLGEKGDVLEKVY